MRRHITKQAMDAIAGKGGKVTKRPAKAKAEPKTSKPAVSYDKLVEQLAKAEAARKEDNKNFTAMIHILQEQNKALAKDVAVIQAKGRVKRQVVTRGDKIPGTQFRPIDSVAYEYEEFH